MKHSNIIRILFILFCINTTSFAAVLTTTLSQNKISIGETFNLIINAPTSGTPDTAPLQKNFTILGTAQNQSLTIFNGTEVQKNQWIITLTPKIAGSLAIPSIIVGKDHTKALTIQVATTQTILKNGQQRIFIETSVTPKNPYVQGQILYQVKIYYDIAVTSAAMFPPTADHAIIKQFGADKTSDIQIKGKSYQVFQRNYLIFPQIAGKLVISPVIFRGAVTDTSSTEAYAGFPSLNVKPIQLIAPSVTLSVQAIPATVGSNWWLPAANLTANETWSVASQQITPGTPLTRIINIKATGLMASQLPPLQSENTTSYNSYVSTPELKDMQANNQLLGIKTEKIVYIPNSSGPVTLPAVTIPWWNTKTNKLETLILPSKTFTVSSGINTKAIETSAPAPKTATPLPNAEHFNVWIIAALIFLCLWLITMLLGWLFWRNKIFQQKTVNAKPTDAISLKQACEANDPHATKNALIQWAKHTFKQNNIFSIADVLPHIQDQVFLQELQVLQNKLYKQTEKAWWGKNLWKCCDRFKVTKHHYAEKNTDDLPLLNPGVEK